MKRITAGIRGSHQWNHYAVVRASLALGSLITMILASGAGSHWH